MLAATPMSLSPLSSIVAVLECVSSVMDVAGAVVSPSFGLLVIGPLGMLGALAAGVAGVGEVPSASSCLLVAGPLGLAGGLTSEERSGKVMLRIAGAPDLSLIHI